MNTENVVDMGVFYTSYRKKQTRDIKTKIHIETALISISQIITWRGERPTIRPIIE